MVVCNALPLDSYRETMTGAGGAVREAAAGLRFSLCIRKYAGGSVLAEQEAAGSRCVFLPVFCLSVFSLNRVACVCPPVLCPHSHARKKSVKNILILVFSAY